jgi:Activator of Hsp90 ATPase homolog 1-like protein
VDPPRRLVFSWGWNHDHAVAPGSTRVEVTFAEENGGTRVVLRHAGLPNAEQNAHHRKGWELYLGRLTLASTGRDPDREPTADTRTPSPPGSYPHPMAIEDGQTT